MKRVVFSTTFALLAILVLVAPTTAGRLWCARDPIVLIDGTQVQIWVAIPEEFVPYVKDAIEVKIHTPKKIEAFDGDRQIAREVIFLDEGFNGHGEKVSWGDLKDPKDGTIPMQIEVKLKIDKKRLKEDFGKDVEVPVQVTTNVGDLTESYVEYGTHKKTRFDLLIQTTTATEAAS